MISNSIDFEQNKSQLYNVSKTGCSCLFEEPTASNDFADDLEQGEKEIPIDGFPNEIEEIKINQMPENISDVPFENIVKATSEYEKSYKIEIPVPPGVPEPKELNEISYKLLDLAEKFCTIEQKENEKKVLKKLNLTQLMTITKLSLNLERIIKIMSQNNFKKL